LRKNIYIINVG